MIEAALTRLEESRWRGGGCQTRNSASTLESKIKQLGIEKRRFTSVS